MASVQEGKKLDHLKKAVFYSADITADRIDTILHALQKLRKEVLRGAGIKDADSAA
jgi:hypothetical protein